MKLNIKELYEIPNTTSKIEFIGETLSPKALEHLIRTAYDYVMKHPNYHVLSNNCRTFVEYLIDQIPEFRDSVPRKNGSILEYYHSQAKHEHPGALIKSKQFLREIHDLQYRNKQYVSAGKLVLDLRLFSVETPDDPEVVDVQL